jgi:hypothetical protein
MASPYTASFTYKAFKLFGRIDSSFLFGWVEIIAVCGACCSVFHPTLRHRDYHFAIAQKSSQISKFVPTTVQVV